MEESTINIWSGSENETGRLLSNLAHTPFELDDVRCESMEGFLQGLKEEKPGRQARIFGLHGHRAKRAGSRRRNRRVRESGTVWWEGEPVDYHSEAYFELVRRALRAKFEQNKDAREALLSTSGKRLVHDTGKPERASTSFPAERFIAMLEEIREEGS